jgi:purine nucleosidase
MKGLRPLALLLMVVGLSGQAAFSESIKVIIDTDPAMGYPFKDVDDGLTLLLALNSPELEILGITTTYGNVRQHRANAKASEILRKAGRSDIPLRRGAAGPEDLGQTTPASRFIVETILAHPGEVTILAIGPLTNIATAIHDDPRIIGLTREVVSIGGNITALRQRTRQSTADLNYGDDPHSAQMVVASGVRFTMINIRLCEEVKIGPGRYDRMITEAGPYAEYLQRSTRIWYYWSLGSFVPWDVVALACLLHPEWFEPNWTLLGFDLQSSRRKNVILYRVDLPEGVGVNVPKTLLREDLFWRWFFERI